MFQHRFGLEVDFNGYIDKFYTDIFEYDNSAEVKKVIEDIIRTVKLTNARLWKKGRNRPEDLGFELLTTIIEYMIESKVFNLRKLINLNGATIIEREYLLNIGVQQYGDKITMRLFNLFDFLIKLLGSNEAVLNALIKTKFPPTMKSHIKNVLVAESIIIIDDQFNNSSINELSYSLNKDIKYVIDKKFWDTGLNYTGTISKLDLVVQSLNVNDFLSRAFTKYTQLRGALIN